MKKRQFIRVTGLSLAGAMAGTFFSCTSDGKGEGKGKNLIANDFTLPDLPYDYDALEPYIDARTMEIHHSRHHAGYVDKLNKALEGSPLRGKFIVDILKEVGPEDTAIRNNGGGHYNHTLFWIVMGPQAGGVPEGEIGAAIDRDFGSFEKFRTSFSELAGSVFGSGWAWLCKNNEGQLFLVSTPNQDNPLMTRITERTGIPVLGIDVWEHAYYLKYQNRRAEYIQGFFNLINWDMVNRLFLDQT